MAKRAAVTKVWEQQERERGSTGAREEDISGTFQQGYSTTAQKTTQMQKKKRKKNPNKTNQPKILKFRRAQAPGA